ncbi:MAG TPA: TolC family protein [Acidobacteriaceae bacterium]|nr:TolC family protein [Acidobacteriaceae bacterium]
MPQLNSRTGWSNRYLRQILTVLVSAISFTLAGYAQRTDAPLPNAPRPTAVLSNSTTPSYLPSSGTTLAMAAPETPPSDPAEQDASSVGDVSLYTIVDLALRNSHAVHVAEADQQRTRAIWMETRDIYIPSFSVGSGLGYSYGFPLGNPTLFNVQSQFLAFSFSQPDYVRSAHAAAKAATLNLKDVRRQVILDASVNYIELNKTLAEIHALEQALADTDKLVSIVQDRLDAGLESKMDLTRAKLTRAQIQLQKIQLEDHADELRQHLSGLTGLDPNAITPSAASVPPLPDLDFQGLLSKENEAPAVQAAFATANARMFEAWGDKRAENRPIVYGAFQYARFASFNGYNQYYRSFTPNNVGVGINATWPLFDRVKHDKAEESAAIAKHDRQQAELAKIQNNESNLALWHSLRELEAQEQVADLQQQLAQDTLTATVTQMNQGGTNGQPVTPQQADQYRVEERTRFVGLQDAQFNVTKVKLDLLSAMGDLEDWAKGSAQPQGNAAIPNSPASSH